MIDKQDIFPIPVFRSFINLDDSVRADLVSEISKLKELAQPKNSPLNTYTDFFQDENILEQESFKFIKTEIDQVVNQINENIGFTTPTFLSKSWATITGFGGYHETHIHAQATWSGVYYLLAESDDAPLCFINPSTVDFNWGEKNCDNFYFSSQIDIPVITDMLVIFPSYLPHKVLQQQNNSDRITIAFNYKT